MLSLLSALLAVTANADYLQRAQFGAAACAGSPLSRSVEFLGCTSAGSSQYRAMSCINSSFGFVKYYATTDCSGAASASSVINGLTWGCDSGSSSSAQVSCVSGTWSAPSSSVTIINYPSSPTCPQTTPADSATSYIKDTCLSVGGSTSGRVTCSSSSYLITTYPSSDCSGVGSTVQNGSIGCTTMGGGQGVSVAQCTSGASSSSIAFAAIALVLVAVTSASAM